MILNETNGPQTKGLQDATNETCRKVVLWRNPAWLDPEGDSFTPVVREGRRSAGLVGPGLDWFQTPNN